MIRLTALLLTFSMLQGCAGLIVAGVVGSAVMLNDERSVQTQLDDTNTDFKISAALAEHQDIKNHTHIRAITVNRKVLLIGQASTEMLRDKAFRLVKGLKLTDTVYNQVRIGRPTSFGTRTNDTWITTKVKGRMVDTKGLDITQVKVITENSEVFLMGLIDRKKAQLAVDVARHTTGVDKVIKVFEYTN
ncbi:MAG: BON domain-containing protein [Parashewanella sp.]